MKSEFMWNETTTRSIPLALNIWCFVNISTIDCISYVHYVYPITPFIRGLSVVYFVELLFMTLCWHIRHEPGLLPINQSSNSQETNLKLDTTIDDNRRRLTERLMYGIRMIENNNCNRSHRFNLKGAQLVKGGTASSQTIWRDVVVINRLMPTTNVQGYACWRGSLCNKLPLPTNHLTTRDLCNTKPSFVYLSHRSSSTIGTRL